MNWCCCLMVRLLCEFLVWFGIGLNGLLIGMVVDKKIWLLIMMGDECFSLGVVIF